MLWREAQQKRATHLDFAEDNFVPEPVLDEAALETGFLGTDCHVKHAGLNATRLACPIVDFVKNAVEEAGHGGEDGGGEFLKIFCDLQNISTKKANGSSGVEKSDLRTSEASGQYINTTCCRALAFTCTHRSNMWARGRYEMWTSVL